MRKPILLVSTLGVISIVSAWMVFNPTGGQFGVSASQLTTYNRLPVPLADMQVRSDGTMRLVGRGSHQIPVEQLAWLVKPDPQVLIIAGGWQGDARAAGPLELKGIRILTLRTGQALALFNSLREQGVRVAIHVHSGC